MMQCSNNIMPKEKLPSTMVSLQKLVNADMSSRRALVLWLISTGVDSNRDIVRVLDTSTSLISQDLSWLRAMGYVQEGEPSQGPQVKTLKMTSKGTKFVNKMQSP